MIVVFVFLFVRSDLPCTDVFAGKKVRRLLALRGDRDHAAVLKGMEYHWIAPFEKHLASLDAEGRRTCNDLLTELEPAVSRFGYSLLNLRALSRPAAFDAHYLAGFDDVFSKVGGLGGGGDA